MSQSQVWANRIVELIKRVKSEANVKTQFEKGLHQIIDATGWELPLISDRERTIIGADRADAVFGHLVIEYEKPGNLKTDNNAIENREIIDRLTKYIKTLSDKKNRPSTGLSTDGRLLLFLYPRRGEFVPTDPRSISFASVQSLLNIMRALHRKILSADELNKAFGPESAAARLGVKVFLNKVTDAPQPKVEAMFREWDRIFGIVYGDEIRRTAEKTKMLANAYRVKNTTQLKPLLFSVHTYFALFIKLLASELLGQLRNVPSLTQQLISLDDSSLKSRISTLEEGKYFTDLGVKNFLDGDLFSWYLETWDCDVAEMVKELSTNLNQYEPATICFVPEKTRDLLKKLYLYLIPKKLRHGLCEYYTPDWLAERLLNQIGYEGNPDKRILDPSCGSGTFLVLIIERIHTFLEDHYGRYPDKSVVLKKVLNNVVGFELNPLAVILARTNYIMTLGDLFKYVKDPIQVPVYLSDSILQPREEIELFYKGYVVHTSAGHFSIPSEVVKANRIDSFLTLLDESIHLQSGLDVFLDRTQRICGLDDESLQAAKPGLIEFYQTLMDLERQNKNGMWTRIIKNAFAPIFVETFDFVVGNPPWIQWGCLSSTYRAATKELWQNYGLLSVKEIGSRSKDTKRDVSILFLYTCSTDYLKNKGRLGFIITQNVFKMKGTGENYRRFQLGKKQRLKILHVDDLVELQPFEEETNRIAVLLLQKGAPTIYPIPYTLWKKKDSVKIAPEFTLEEIMSATQRFNLHASPIDKANEKSPWIVLKPRLLETVQAITRKSDYIAYRGVETDPSGVFQIRVLSEQSEGTLLIENMYDAGKKKIRKIQAVIEADFVYPLLRGKDISRWRTNLSIYVLFVQDPQKKTEFDKKWMEANVPMTLDYLKNFEDILRNRFSKFARKLTKKDAFYSISGIDTYTFSPHQVMWQRRSTDVQATAISTRSPKNLNEKDIILDASISFIPCEDAKESHYVCALLNSSLTKSVLQAFFDAGHSRGVSPILDHIAIPRFNPSNPIHQGLAELSLQAHRLVALRHEGTRDIRTSKKRAGLFLKKIEEEIDEKAAKLWDITDEALIEIKRSLRELY